MKVRETPGNLVGIVTTRKGLLLIYVGTFVGCKCSYVAMMKTHHSFDFQGACVSRNRENKTFKL